MPERKDFDAVVVGAGTAGAACALNLARTGLRVALVERRPLEEAGAGWVNFVPPWMFEQARIPVPKAPENRGMARAFVLTGKYRRSRIVIEPCPTLGVDVRLLIKRLHRLARQEGVQMFDRLERGRLQLDGQRPVSLDAGGLSFQARLFVDASGMSAALRRQVPVLNRRCPDVRPEDTCTAAQEVCEVADRAGAEAFLQRHRLGPGRMVAQTGVCGGFSTSNLMVSEDFETVELLAGSIADGRHSSGPGLLKSIKRRESWIGETVFGGAGLIPLRRPYDRLGAPGIALVGDSACQVFPAHGSGTGLGMLAGRILAEAVEEHIDPGSKDVVRSYQKRFLQKCGPVCAAYDVFRRFSQSLSGEELEELLGSGLITEANYRAGLNQEMPAVKPADLAKQALGLARHPKFIGLTLQLARMATAYARLRHLRI